jgi:DNA (cytosine-5)-methyltransferase 1
MPKYPLTVGSLFSGIGGFDLAAQWMGWITRWMVENNPHCRRVLRNQYPHARLYRDVRRVDFSAVEPVDILVGGFPCQPHSSANSTERRTAHASEDFLWPFFANAIRMVRPTYVVVENVPNVVHDGTLPIILKDLATSGYDAEWDIIPASAVNAPHQRERLWITAYTRGFGMERPSPRKRPRKTKKGWTDCASPLHEFAKAPFARRDGIPEPLLLRVDDGFSAWKDQIRAIGNAIVPQVAFNFPFRAIHRMEHYRHRRLAKYLTQREDV